MILASLRLITEDVDRLVRFYEEVTGLPATRLTPDFAELPVPGCTLAIGSTRTMALFAAGAAQGGANRSVIVEFRVADVDAAFERLAPVLETVLQRPTTMPWGNRSLLFRDPDGSLVNLFTPVSAAAIARFGPLPS